MYQGRSDGGGYWYLYPPKSAKVNFLWGKMTSERLFNSFIHPQKLLYPPPKKKQISGYASAVYKLRPTREATQNDNTCKKMLMTQFQTAQKATTYQYYWIQTVGCCVPETVMFRYSCLADYYDDKNKSVQRHCLWLFLRPYLYRKITRKFSKADKPAR